MSEGKPKEEAGSRSSCCYLPNRVLFEIPTDGDSLYRWAELTHIPRVGEEVVLTYPKGIIFDEVMVKAVRHHFNWRCVVVVLSRLDMGETLEIENKFKADGWIDYFTMIGR